MKKHKIEFLQSALDDLDEIILYISKDSKKSAIKLHEKIMSVINKLSDFPLIGILVPDEKIGKNGFRMLSCGKYLIFYKIYDKRVVILRIIHGARNYPYLLIKFINEN